MTVDTKVKAARSLKPDELDDLQRCIDGVQSGEVEFYVLLTNKKQTRSKRRVPGVHYAAHPALAPHAHKGWLVAAPLNAKGEVYLHIFDDARAKERGENFGHTRVTLRGLRSFEILRERPGPLAEPTVPAFDPQVAMTQAMFLQAQALTLAAQAMLARAQQR